MTGHGKDLDGVHKAFVSVSGSARLSSKRATPCGLQVEGIDPLNFLAGCPESQLIKPGSVCPVSWPSFFLSVSVVLPTRATCCVMLFVCSVSWLFLLGCQYQC